MGLPASSRQKGPAAAKTSETGCQKEDETRSHREHVCSWSYLLGTEHARSSGTRSTRLYQEMRRGGAGHRHTGTLLSPSSLCYLGILGILNRPHHICCLTASLTQEQPKMCDKVRQPNNVPHNKPLNSAFGITGSKPSPLASAKFSQLSALALLRCSTRACLHTWEMRQAWPLSFLT